MTITKNSGRCIKRVAIWGVIVNSGLTYVLDLTAKCVVQAPISLHLISSKIDLAGVKSDSQPKKCDSKQI